VYCFCINLSFFISPELSCERWPYPRLSSSSVAWNVAARGRETDRIALQPLASAHANARRLRLRRLILSGHNPGLHLPLDFQAASPGLIAVVGFLDDYDESGLDFGLDLNSVSRRLVVVATRIAP